MVRLRARRIQHRVDGVLRWRFSSKEANMLRSSFAVVFLALVAAAQTAPTRRAPDVPYLPTTDSAVDAMLKLAEVKSSDVVYDLGCGDGRLVIAAAKEYGAHGVGIDINPDRIREANENAAKAGVQSLVRF